MDSGIRFHRRYYWFSEPLQRSEIMSKQSWKTKAAGIFIGVTIVLATLPASTVLFTIGAVVVTPAVISGVIGAILGGWGISDKGDKIISAIQRLKEGCD